VLLLDVSRTRGRLKIGLALSEPNLQTSILDRQPVNKAITIDFAHATPADVAADLHAPAHPQSLLDLPPGEARESLLAVHGVLGSNLPPNKLAIYEAGGGSTSFLPLDVLRRAM